jgi:hypothetical protein
MSNFLKDLSILVFAAGEEIEKKAKEFRSQREARYKEFDEKLQAKKAEWKEKSGEKRDSIQQLLAGVPGKLGLASKAEVDEIKSMLADLNRKLDELKK